MTRYIWTMPTGEQCEIMHALMLAGVEGDDLERAMDSRLCDLEDTIEIGRWL